MDERITDFTSVEHIAVVGVSKHKFGGTAYRTLKQRGYRVYPVHPRLETFEGDRCYARLTDLPDAVKAAVITVQPAQAEAVVNDAQAAGIPRLWFQQGADFSAAVKRAEAHGSEVVSGKCILLYAPPVTGIHALHRFFARLFGRL